VKRVAVLLGIFGGLIGLMTSTTVLAMAWYYKPGSHDAEVITSAGWTGVVLFLIGISVAGGSLPGCRNWAGPR
jgi:hypothetical protein